jgi:hypothetical protein
MALTSVAMTFTILIVLSPFGQVLLILNASKEFII